MKYTEDDEIVILSLLILGNSFPITEHPFEIDKNEDVIYEIQSQKEEIRRMNKIKINQSQKLVNLDFIANHYNKDINLISLLVNFLFLSFSFLLFSFFFSLFYFFSFKKIQKLIIE